MKRYTLIAVALLCALLSQAQTTKNFVFYKGDQVVLTLPTSQVDSIVLAKKNEPVNPDPEPEPEPEPVGYEMVDLGLSVKWASHNVGATLPGEYGNYYRWGETFIPSSYAHTTYHIMEDPLVPINISGTDFDVAHKEWGSDWRMPTVNEMEELVEKCTWKWSFSDGNFGARVTGPNGNSIFLPVAGYYDVNGDMHYEGSAGRYWTANDRMTNFASYLTFDDVVHEMSYHTQGKTDGVSIRPVYGPVDWVLTPRSERNRLLLFDDNYSETTSTWHHNDYWGTSHMPEEWYGVTLDDEGHVVSINLENNNIEGVMRWVDLPYLKTLYVSNNKGPLYMEVKNTDIDSLTVENSQFESIQTDNLTFLKIKGFTGNLSFDGKIKHLEMWDGSVYNENVFHWATINELIMSNVSFKTILKPTFEILILKNSQIDGGQEQWAAKVSKRFECINSTIDSPVKYTDFSEGCEMVFENATIRLTPSTVKILNCSFTNSAENWIKYVIEQ